MKIDLNSDFKKALDLLENSSKNVFITGKAGTGKSTLLTYFREHTKKKVVVLAPTGVAALNIRGQTIHSFFRFKPDITLEKVKKVNRERGGKIYQKLDVIIIDEISMVRSDLMDCIDKFMRLNGKNSSLPFGGAQMIFFGDLYQLPPVVTGQERELFRTLYQSQYFFDAKVFTKLDIALIELSKIYRQKDDAFINILNAVRNNSVQDDHLSGLNTRVRVDYQPDDSEFCITLTTTNDKAEEINREHLEKLPGKIKTYQGERSGAFDLRSLPAKEELTVKVGAQVMLVNNDSMGRWVNGSIGKVYKIQKGDEDSDFRDVILVELQDGEIVEVLPNTWELFNYTYNEETKQIKTETSGTFTQYPLILSWAITIHKSQGKTFNKVIIDLGKGSFAHGQTYVALSRCTCLEGIFLKKPVEKKHILMDWRVVRFLTSFQYNLSEKSMPLKDKINLLENALEYGNALKITYLKSNDEKSERIIKPLEIGEMEYLGRKFPGVSAFDSKRGEPRTFRIDKILTISKV